MTPKVIVITGATGTGKTTVQEYLAQHYPVTRIVTHTTRPPRAGEVDGRDYYFETEQSFQQRHYLESVVYSGYHYGSSREGIAAGFKRAPFPAIVLDTKGAITYARELGNQVVILFLTVSDPDQLMHRVTARGDDTVMLKQRFASPEYRRDLTMPLALKGRALQLNNDNWTQTQRKLDELMQHLQAE
ncbi:guanylate kinase [Levilactobacillus namurensis DSM 19117]|uniref:Guanylate kinase n=1 Tax=Levilactobacillus namurensis DSM 19117 TaxID=1423773 RepID=A0A0R1JRA4_9LACO|nr:guanylate kinase [Levilactobacillus namurensis]KRK73611.1 guanylate kinase [Levilactobacillus namurensis DSM 19117]GEO75472.1 guanylate kinase [Levilactobacillus namurensis]